MNSLAHLPERDATVDVIAANIRAEVARAGLKDGEFAVEMGMTPMSMSRRLSGATPFTTSEVQRIAGYFRVPVGDMFEDKGHRPTEPAPPVNDVLLNAHDSVTDATGTITNLADWRAQRVAS